MFLLAQITNGSNDWSGSLNALGRFFSVIIAILFVMALAWFATRMIAGTRFTRRGSSNLKLIEGINLGFQSNAHLVRAGNRYYLLGVTKERVNLIAEIPADEVTEPTAEIPFERYLRGYAKKTAEENRYDKGTPE